MARSNGFDLKNPLLTSLPEPGVQDPLVIFIAIPLVDYADAQLALSHHYKGNYFDLDARNPHEQVKKITLQAARRIACIFSPRPVGFHRCFGAPLAERRLPGDGLFSGRRIVNVALIDNPISRWKALERRTPRGIDPLQVANQQCMFLSGSATNRTFEAAKARLEQASFLVATSDQWADLWKLGESALGWPALNATTNQVESEISASPTDEEAEIEEYDRFTDEDMKLYEWASENP